MIIIFSILVIPLIHAQWQGVNRDPLASPQMLPSSLKFGDMMMTDKQKEALKNGDSMGTKDSSYAAVNDLNIRWKDAVIPYEIDCSLENLEDAVDAITKAMQEWENKTCIRFVKHTNEKYFLTFFRNTHCWGNVGQVSYSRISVGDGCEYQHVMTHEIGHVVGYYHEQNRMDRDQWVKVHWENIAQFKDAFDLVKNTDSLGFSYDYSSIMHYPWHAFSSNGKDTMTPIQDTRGKVPYIELSEGDILQTSKMYNCPAVEKRRHAARSKRHSGDFNGKHVSFLKKKCVDDNQYCADWASIGYCSIDPYTQQHCRKSCKSPVCNEVSPTKAPTEIPGKNCLDVSKYCPGWASAGYCSTNSYTKENCRLSCPTPGCKGVPTAAPTIPPRSYQPTDPPTPATTEVPVTADRTFLGKGTLCIDTHPSCPEFAKRGECKLNPGWMLKNCMVSCKTAQCDQAGLKPQGSCANPLGLSWDGTNNFKIPDSAFYSPDHLSPGSGWNASAMNARLYYRDDHDERRIGAWCAASHNQAKSDKGFVQVDLGKTKRISFIATQGRDRYFERVGKFKIQYGVNGLNFKTYEENGVDKVFTGNCDHVTPVLNKFTPFQARYLRYIPTEWNYPCVRMEFYGC